MNPIKPSVVALGLASLLFTAATLLSAASDPQPLFVQVKGDDAAIKHTVLSTAISIIDKNGKFRVGTASESSASLSFALANIQKAGEKPEGIAAASIVIKDSKILMFTVEIIALANTEQRIEKKVESMLQELEK